MSRLDIPDLPPDHHHAVDWARLRRALTLDRPVRAAVTVCAGAAFAPWWCRHVVLPLIATEGIGAAFGAATLAAITTTAAMANSNLRPLARRLAAALLVTAITATFYAEPVRHTIATWIMEN